VIFVKMLLACLAIMVRMSHNNHVTLTMLFSRCITSHYPFTTFHQLSVWLTGEKANRRCRSFNLMAPAILQHLHCQPAH